MSFLSKMFNFFNNDNISAPPKDIGRNEPCWCGSGKKYKKCHLDNDEKKRSENRSVQCGTT